MTYNRKRHSIRLKDYNYTAEGAYFITICVKDRECLLGEIINNQMIINNIGKIILTGTEVYIKNYYLSEKIGRLKILTKGKN